MAEGPPDNDGAIIGFPSKWRSTPVVSNLSWANLLSHLLIPLETHRNGSVFIASDGQQLESGTAKMNEI